MVLIKATKVEKYLLKHVNSIEEHIHPEVFQADQPRFPVPPNENVLNLLNKNKINVLQNGGFHCLANFQNCLNETLL